MFTIKSKTVKANQYFFATQEEAEAFVEMAKTNTLSVVNTCADLLTAIVEGLFLPNGQPMSAVVAMGEFLYDDFQTVEIARISINGVEVENTLANDKADNIKEFLCEEVTKRIVSGETITSVTIEGKEVEFLNLSDIFNNYWEEDPTKLPYDVACGVLFGNYSQTQHFPSPHCPAHRVKSLPSALASVMVGAQRVVSERHLLLEKLAEIVRTL